VSLSDCIFSSDQNSGDKPLATALEMIYNEAITSLPVLDNQKNVVGNISHADVRVRSPLSPLSADSVATRGDEQRKSSKAAPWILHIIYISHSVRARHD
jgi:CBS-domain-containing membrane protein